MNRRGIDDVLCQNGSVQETTDVDHLLLRLHIVLNPQLVRFSGFDGDHVFGSIGAFDAEHFSVAVSAEVTHLVGDFLPRVPYYG